VNKLLDTRKSLFKHRQNASSAFSALYGNFPLQQEINSSRTLIIIIGPAVAMRCILAAHSSVSRSHGLFVNEILTLTKKKEKRFWGILNVTRLFSHQAANAIAKCVD
jgi:hypothetical protein